MTTVQKTVVRISRIADWVREDRSLACIIFSISVVLLWLVLTPLAAPIARQTMKRFHLKSESFIGWACQFPVPSMYNFANQYQVDSYPPGLISPLLDESEPRHLNHFPARCFTFADGRYEYLRLGKNQWFTLKSSYRGQELTSKFHLKPTLENSNESTRKQYEVVRLTAPKE